MVLSAAFTVFWYVSQIILMLVLMSCFRELISLMIGNILIISGIQCLYCLVELLISRKKKKIIIIKWGKKQSSMNDYDEI